MSKEKVKVKDKKIVEKKSGDKSDKKSDMKPFELEELSHDNVVNSLRYRKYDDETSKIIDDVISDHLIKIAKDPEPKTENASEDSNKEVEKDADTIENPKQEELDQDPTTDDKDEISDDTQTPDDADVPDENDEDEISDAKEEGEEGEKDSDDTPDKPEPDTPAPDTDDKAESEGDTPAADKSESDKPAPDTSGSTETEGNDLHAILLEKLEQIAPSSDLDDKIAQISAESIAAIAKKLHLVLPADFEAIIRDGLIGEIKNLHKDGNITLTVHPEREKKCKEILQSDSIPSKFKDKYKIECDDSFGKDDCRLEWENTKLEYNQEQLNAEIDKIVEQLKNAS